MSSSAAIDADGEAPGLVCQIDSVQGIIDALASVRWKRHQVSNSYSTEFRFILAPAVEPGHFTLPNLFLLQFYD